MIDQVTTDVPTALVEILRLESSALSDQTVTLHSGTRTIRTVAVPASTRSTTLTATQL
jgi:hypothetical protein